jgi:hypothetical protein
MRSTLWLIFFLIRHTRPTLGLRGLISPRSWNWKDLLKWLVMEKIVGRSYSFIKTVLKMRVIDVPGLVKIEDTSMDTITTPDKFHFVDKDLNKETIYKNFKTPKIARYKIVSFHSEGIPVIEMLIIAFFKRWKPANLDEALSVSSSCDLKALGLGESHNLLAFGTIIKRSSAIFSICCPMVVARLVEKEITGNEKRISLYLHDIFNNCPTGQHILFRAS